MGANAVLGMFTWSDDPAFHHREIDVEISRWSDATKPNAQSVVEPYQKAADVFRFEVGPGSVHEFLWLGDSVRFEGRVPEASLGRFVVASEVPEPGGENARINLCVNAGLKFPKSAD